MIAAIVPAAGRGQRMGGPTPKPLLPWGRHTVVEQVVETLHAAGIAEIIVVTGHRAPEIEAVLASHPARCLFNPNFAGREMLSSIQVGLMGLPAGTMGALLALADQPQIEVAVVRRVMDAFERSQGRRIVVPSYQMRRGHPILLPSELWPQILDLPPGESLRTVLRAHAAGIEYVVVDTPGVLADLDTPADYRLAVAQNRQAEKTQKGISNPMQPTLTTKRLTLRPFTVADAPEVQRLAGARAVASTTQNIPHPYEDGMAEQWIDGHQALLQRGEGVVFAVVRQADGQLLGAISLLRLTRQHARADLGYWIGEPFWGHGYATEAARALIAYGFDALALNRIHASHLARNPASGRVMQKAGMTYEGTLRQHFRKWDVYEDIKLYGILREDARTASVG